MGEKEDRKMIKVEFKAIKQGANFYLDNSTLSKKYTKENNGGKIGDIWIAIRFDAKVFVEKNKC